MKLDKNHPKLTAYALGDLPSEEIQAMKPFIDADPELSAVVQDIQLFAETLSAGLASEQSERMQGAQRAELRGVVEKSKKRNFWFAAGVLLPVLSAGLIIFMLVPDFQIVQKKQELTLWEDQEYGEEESLESADDSIRSQPSVISAPAPVSKPKPSFKGGLGGAATPGQGVASRSRGLAGPMKKSNKAKSPTKPSLRRDAKVAPAEMDGESYYGEKAPADSQWASQDEFNYVEENDFQQAKQTPLSTFSVDVDTGSYTMMRSFIDSGRLPPKDSVRIEEYVNYFDYDYKGPTNQHPFAVHLETANAPWKEGHQLVRVALKAKEVDKGERKAANLVFLMDVSGSMSSANKLPLVKQSFRTLIKNLNPTDRVAIVVYAGASGVVLPSTEVREQAKIISSLNNLSAGGSTNGGAGIKLAYSIAQKNFKEDGVNRVILATDGDFNVGTTGQGSLIRLIKKYTKSNIFLTVLGLGMGNYKDGQLEQIANKGNGNYFYIDSQKESDKVFSHQLTGTLETVAKDVKIQVEFNPNVVQAYRLVGYENRKLAAEDFNNDKKDAGEIGAGHSVTAFYEVVPVGVPFQQPGVDNLKYQKAEKSIFDVFKSKDREMMTVKLRYKKPKGSKSTLMTRTLDLKNNKFAEASEGFRFGASVAAYALILKDSKYKGSAELRHIEKSASQSMKNDPFGYKKEFLELVRKARRLK